MLGCSPIIYPKTFQKMTEKKLYIFSLAPVSPSSVGVERCSWAKSIRTQRVR